MSRALLSLAVVALLALLFVGGAHAFADSNELSSEWVEPEYTELIELGVEDEELEAEAEADAEAEEEFVEVEATPAKASTPVGRATTKPTPVVSTGVVVAAEVPVNAPTGLPVGDLSPTEELYDSAEPEQPLQFSEDTGIRKAENAIPLVDRPRLSYNLDGLTDFGVVASATSAPSAAAPQIPYRPVVGSTGAPTVAPRIPYAYNVIAMDATEPLVYAPKAVAPTSSDLCGAYAGKPIFHVAGNNGEMYAVVKLLAEHAEDPSSLTYSPNERDNTIRTATACAFDKMYTAAKAAGINLRIASAFRSQARQQYFWNCHITKKCNKGRLAAKPGTSNHGRGIALDLNQSAQGGAVYRWLAKNAQSFGFVRTVPKEKWHWEFRPGTPKAKYT